MVPIAFVQIGRYLMQFVLVSIGKCGRHSGQWMPHYVSSKLLNCPNIILIRFVPLAVCGIVVCFGIKHCTLAHKGTRTPTLSGRDNRVFLLVCLISHLKVALLMDAIKHTYYVIMKFPLIAFDARLRHQMYVKFWLQYACSRDVHNATSRICNQWAIIWIEWAELLACVGPHFVEASCIQRTHNTWETLVSNPNRCSYYALITVQHNKRKSASICKKAQRA